VVGARAPEEILNDVACLSTDIPDALFLELLHDREDFSIK
jgi:hypothetical protein